MDIIDSNCIDRSNRNNLQVTLNNKVYTIKYKDISKETIFKLSLYYKTKLKDISITENIPESQLLDFLIDYYYLSNSLSINVLIKQLSKRLFLGVDKGFIIQIRTLYTTLGHFLKKLRYI